MNLKKQDLFWILPLALTLGFVISSLQNGGWLGFSFLFLLSLTLLKVSHSSSSGDLDTPRDENRGATRPPEFGIKKTLGWIITLAFALRLVGGVATYIFLPLYGHQDSSDGLAGYTYTDAHKRDEQAWTLASSDKPLADAFSGKYSSDQYGGLLALSALIYRYLSPDAHRPLMMILLAAFIAALGVSFLWRGTTQVFGEKVAWASAWIFALYPESVLLGGSAMREPYLITLSAIAFWGFVEWQSRAPENPSGLRERSVLRLRASQQPLSPPLRTNIDQGNERSRSALIALGLSLLGMLLLSPAVAVFTLVLFAGWMFFSRERASISWKPIIIFALVFLVGLFALSSSLNRKGVFDTTSPMSVLNDWIQLSVKWNVYQIERESGWVQKLFDEMPEAARIPFVAVYGLLQPVLPAALVVPTLPIWKVIYVLRALGWYALLPLLILSTVAGASLPVEKNRAESRRNLFVWLSLLSWTWILLAALRGGGDQWDNPRYRMLLFVWEALVAGQVYVWWRETRNAWFTRVVACETVFVLIFGQWYASRYFYVGGQLPFAVMIALIVGLWGAILGGGWWLDKMRGQPRAM